VISVLVLPALLALFPAAARAYTGTCTVFATPVNFGAYDPLTPNRTLSTGTITFECSPDAGNGSFDLTLSPGGSGDYNARRMASGANTLAYQLYLNSARTQVWADFSCGGNCVVSGFSTVPTAGGSARFTVYGSLPAQQLAPKGTYTDVIRVTLTF
jgi:spore coat protein U-like protein